MELRWFTAVFANVSARPFVGGTCSTHKAPAWANHALATAVRWRSAGKCKICLSWKTPITSSESPKTTADAMSDSATHWQAVAKGVNSATLLDIAPDNHSCQRRRALMGLWRTRRRSLMTCCGTGGSVVTRGFVKSYFNGSIAISQICKHCTCGTGCTSTHIQPRNRIA